MNKKTINGEIETAYQALSHVGIAKNNRINKAFRGQISTFGAAITTGSLLPAIAFFSDQGGASVERNKLLEAILYILKDKKKVPEECRDLFTYAKKEPENSKEDIINAAIALKLAMNLYKLEDQERR